MKNYKVVLTKALVCFIICLGLAFGLMSILSYVRNTMGIPIYSCCLTKEERIVLFNEGLDTRFSYGNKQGFAKKGVLND
jgi:hypothetical protein